MKRIINIVSVLLLVCFTFISCERENIVCPEEQDGRPIEFIVESEWPEMTKAAITGISDLYGDGFRVWANMTSYDNEALDNIPEIFDAEGTTIYAVDKDEDGLFVPGIDSSSDVWEYDDKKRWYKGYYSFAAVLPDSKLLSNSVKGELSSSFSKTDNSQGGILNYENTLTLDFGDGGFNLAEQQADFMYAFSNVDNSKSDASEVTFDFKHVFSLLDIRLSYNSVIPKVNSLLIYGIHSTVFGKLQYYQNMRSENGNVEITDSNNMDELLKEAEVSTEVNPYYSSTSFSDSENEITLVDNLIVFPEQLSETCYLGIIVNITINGQTKDVYASITSGEWVPGESYVYQFNVDNIEL